MSPDWQARGLPLVMQAMVAHGWAESDVRAVLGGNVHRLLVGEIGWPG